MGMLEINDVHSDQVLESYVAALVFVVTTYTTIGYGEQNVVSPREKVMAMVFMVAGGFMLATIKDVIVNFRKQATLIDELSRIRHEAQDFYLAISVQSTHSRQVTKHNEPESG